MDFFPAGSPSDLLVHNDQADYIAQPITNTAASSNTLLAINIIIHNNHVFVIDQNYGLCVYDLANPTRPNRLSPSLNLPITPSNN